MKHHRSPTVIENVSSDDESLHSQGPLCKRQKRSHEMAPAMTLQSLIHAGELLKQEDIGKYETSRKELPTISGRVTPTKEQLKAEDKQGCSPSQNDKELGETGTDANLTQPLHIPQILPALNSSNWRKCCRPLAAPPTLPRVLFGANGKRASNIPTKVFLRSLSRQ